MEIRNGHSDELTDLLGNARAFKPLPLCSAPMKLTTRENVFWENAVGYLRNSECMLELSNLCHCVQHPWILTDRDFWSSRHERKPLSKQKCVLRKCCGVSQKQWVLELSNLCHCIQHPWKLTSGDFWSSRGVDLPILYSSWPQDVSTGG